MLGQDLPTTVGIKGCRPSKLDLSLIGFYVALTRFAKHLSRCFENKNVRYLRYIVINQLGFLS
jgi:hypothetical protein